MALALHDAVRAIQVVCHGNLDQAARAAAADMVMTRVQNISRGKNFQDLGEADREELVQQTLVRVIQSSKPLHSQNDGAATLYLQRTFQRVFLDHVTEDRPARTKSRKKEEVPEPAARPHSATLRPEDTMFESRNSEEDRAAIKIDLVGPEDVISANEGLKWAVHELFVQIKLRLPGDYARGLEDLRRLRSKEATMDDLLGEEGIDSESSAEAFTKARDRIYARHHRTLQSVLQTVGKYDDEGERYYLLQLLTELQPKKKKKK